MVELCFLLICWLSLSCSCNLVKFGGFLKNKRQYSCISPIEILLIFYLLATLQIYVSLTILSMVYYLEMFYMVGMAECVILKLSFVVPGRGCCCK